MNGFAFVSFFLSDVILQICTVNTSTYNTMIKIVEKQHLSSAYVVYTHLLFAGERKYECREKCQRVMTKLWEVDQGAHAALTLPWSPGKEINLTQLDGVSSYEIDVNAAQFTAKCMPIICCLNTVGFNCFKYKYFQYFDHQTPYIIFSSQRL